MYSGNSDRRALRRTLESIFASGFSCDIRDQPTIAILVPNDSGSLLNSWLLFERSLYFSQLYAKTAKFDLAVTAAQAIELSTRQQSTQIASSINPIMRSKRIIHKLLAGQFWIIQVAAR